MRHPDVAACFSHALCRTAAALADAPRALDPPTETYTISVFPTNDPWHWPAPHIDHALKSDAHVVFPPPFLIGCLVYLNSVPAQNGATVVWPASHHALHAFSSAHREEYRYMWQLNRDIGRAGLGPPVEVTVEAGDVLFYHYLCAHAGSRNTGAVPRFALNHKW